MNSHHTLALDQALAWIKTVVDPLGVLVSGSILRGNPDAASDLDIFVFHDQGFRQRIQRRFNGVACEIFLNTVAHVPAYFEREREANRPVTAHLLATGQFLLGESTPDLCSLVAEAKRYVSLAASLTTEQLTFRRYGIATLFEDATDCLVSDPPTALYALEKAVAQTIELVFVTQQQPLPRLKERLATLRTAAPVAGALATQFYEAATTAQKYAAAQALVLAVVGELGFFEWESARS